MHNKTLTCCFQFKVDGFRNKHPLPSNTAQQPSLLCQNACCNVIVQPHLDVMEPTFGIVPLIWTLQILRLLAKMGLIFEHFQNKLSVCASFQVLNRLQVLWKLDQNCTNSFGFTLPTFFNRFVGFKYLKLIFLLKIQLRFYIIITILSTYV